MNDPFFGEVATRKNLSHSEPQAIGRYLNNERGSLLIQVRGTDAQGTSTALLEELLDDPSIGVRTPPSLNAAGKQIEDFGVEKSITEVHELR